MSKEGSTLSGVMDGLALTLSIGLHYGVPLKVLVDKLINTRFEPFEQLRAICLWSSPNSNRSRRTSLSFRMDNFFAGRGSYRYVLMPLRL